MPIIKSAKKRMRQEAVRRTRNQQTKKSLRSEVKALAAALEAKDKKKADTQLKKVYSALDTAAKKNVIHKNKAARKKASYAKMVKETFEGSSKKSATKTAEKKTPAKKPAAKKTAAKKPAAKKTASEK